jgi:hypothetical protein
MHILTKLGGFGKIASMPRTARVALEGMVFYVLNRSVGRMQRLGLELTLRGRPRIESA